MLAGSCQQALTHLRWRPSGKMLTATLRCGERTFVRGRPGQNPVGSPVWIGVIQHVTRFGHYCGEKCHFPIASIFLLSFGIRGKVACTV